MAPRGRPRAHGSASRSCRARFLPLGTGRGGRSSEFALRKLLPWFCLVDLHSLLLPGAL